MQLSYYRDVDAVSFVEDVIIGSSLYNRTYYVENGHTYCVIHKAAFDAGVRLPHVGQVVKVYSPAENTAQVTQNGRTTVLKYITTRVISGCVASADYRIGDVSMQ
jgi:hypothetical protein